MRRSSPGAREYRQSHPNVEVSWDRRTLREFGEAPIEQYANRYDLIVIDHPFVGYAAAHDVLVNLAPFVTAAERQGFAQRFGRAFVVLVLVRRRSLGASD